MGLAFSPLQPAKVFLNFSTRKKIIVISAAAIILAILLTAGYALGHRDITIADNGKTYMVTVIGGNVQKAVEKAGLKLNKEDLIEPALKTSLKKGMRIKITRAFPVKLIVDGRTMDFMTPYNRVEKILQVKKIKLGALDRVEPGKDAQITKGSVIKVVRVEVKTETRQEEIAYKVERVNDNNMQKGQTRNIQAGKNGLAEVVVRIVFEDGKEVKKEVINRKVVREPVKSIVAVGTISYMVASRGETLKYSKVVRMYATWYTARPGARTASGMVATKGVASVPRWIPFGTKLYIPGYGYAIAADRGSAITGDKIDLFFDHNEGWTSRYVDVYFLE